MKATVCGVTKGNSEGKKNMKGTYPILCETIHGETRGSCLDQILRLFHFSGQRIRVSKPSTSMSSNHFDVYVRRRYCLGPRL